MGYTVVVYLVPLDKLHALYRLNDSTILNEIEVRFTDDLAALNLWWEEEVWLEGEEKPPIPSIREIILANLAGSFPWTEVPYVAVLELFCKYVGTPLPNDMFEGLRPHGVGFVEREEPQMGQLVFRTPSPIAIPGVEEERMYRVGHITPETAAQMLARRDPNAWVHLNDPEAWEHQAAAQCYSWLEKAVETQQGIVTFFQ